MCLEFRTTESGVVKTLSLKIKNIALSLCMLIFVFGWLTVYFVAFNFATLFRYVYLICPACVMINNTGLSQPSLFLSYFNKEHLLRLCIMATNNLIWIIFTILWEKNISGNFTASPDSLENKALIGRIRTRERDVRYGRWNASICISVW